MSAADAKPLEELSKAFLHRSATTAAKYETTREEKGKFLLKQVKTRGAEGEDTLPVEPAASERIEIDLYAFGRQLGTIAPCGCTTDPPGGLQ